MVDLVSLEDPLDVNLKRIESALREGSTTIKETVNSVENYITATEYLKLEEFWYDEKGIPVPPKVRELRKACQIIGAEQDLIAAKTELEGKHFGRALNDLDRVKRYSNEAGIQVPDEVDELIKTASKMGTGYHLTAAKKAFGAGDYRQTLTDLNWVERYSKMGGIPVPKKVTALRDEIKELRAGDSKQ